MHKRIPILLFVTAALLAFAQPRQYTVYVPLVYRHAVFKIACHGQILCDVYEDTDGDGRRDDSEVGLPGIRLILRSYDRSNVRTVTTDRSGYCSMAVEPGRYELQAEKPSGYRWTTPHARGIDIECATIQVNFGLEPIAGSASAAH